MIDPSMTLAEFGRDYVRASAKVAKKRVFEDGIPHIVDHGHILIKQSDAEAWREARTHTPEAPSLKSLLRQISEDVLNKRKSA